MLLNVDTSPDLHLTCSRWVQLVTDTSGVVHRRCRGTGRGTSTWSMSASTPRTMRRRWAACRCGARELELHTFHGTDWPLTAVYNPSLHSLRLAGRA